MGPHDGHASAPAHASQEHAPDATEAFPRRWIAEIVSQEERASRARSRWQILIFAAAATFFALAFPTQSLLGEGPALVQASEEGAWLAVHLALVPLAKLLGFVPLAQGEAAWFLVSALCFGASIAALARALDLAGFPARASLCATLATAAAPAAWVAATLPGPASPGFLGACIVLASTFARVDERAGDRAVAWSFGLALLCDLRIALLAPALVWAAASQCTAGVRRTGRAVDRALALSIPLAAVAAVIAVAAWIVPTAPASQFGLAAWNALCGSGPGGAATLWTLIFGSGAAAFGFLILLLPPRTREESRPPAWIWAWCGFPLAFQMLFGRADLSTVVVALLPIAALGIAKAFEDKELGTSVRMLAVMLAGQAAFAWGFQTGLASRDANANWSAAAAEALKPSDLVLSADPDHLYLLRHRFALETIDLGEPRTLAPEAAAEWFRSTASRLRRAAEQGRRAAFDVAAGLDDHPYAAEVKKLRWIGPAIELAP